MAFYSNPEEMYNARANRFKRDGDMHWALACTGEGDYHYGKAKRCYAEVERNIVKANEAKGKTFK